MDNQQPSTSSSLSGQQQEMAKVGDKQVEKRLKEESKSDSENQTQIQLEVEAKCFIDDLPPEMLMKILSSNLDIKSLANCRLVSRIWNISARKVLQSRDDVETVFYCREREGGIFEIKGKSERVTLENFIECFQDSKESPLYTRFLFNNMKVSVLGDLNWDQFASDFGENIKCLKLVTVKDRTFRQVIEFAGQLGYFLLDELPNLSEFGLDFPYSSWYINNPNSSEIELFSPEATTKNENENQETTKTTTTIQLPHLKVLYFDENSFSIYPGIFTDLLRASINLQRIEPFYNFHSYRSVETFQLLQSLGKLHCLQIATINLDSFVSETMEKIASLELTFKLKKLNLYADPYIRLDQLAEMEKKNKHASVFLSNLFESSKDTLKELKTNPVEFLPQLQIPKFSKLTNLIVVHRGPLDLEETPQVLPSGINLEEIFPVLQNLDLLIRWTDFFPCNEKVSALQNVKNLKITGRLETKEDIARISQLCPNLKNFTVGDGNYYFLWNFPEVGDAIWTHLTKLEALELYIDLDNPAISFPAVDSCFTGFSRNDCIRLHNFIKDQKSTENQGSQEKFSQFETVLDAERGNFSILELKDLRNLKVSLISRNWDNGGNVDSDEYKITRDVIEKYALKLMKNLTYKIE